LDTFNNKRLELDARISMTNPDIFGVTEINPKTVA